MRRLKPYKSCFKESSLDNLKDPEIVTKIVEFIKQNPFPKDHEDFHEWAETQGYEEAGELEEYVHAILTVILTGGASQGKEINGSDENKEIGKKVEIEHVSLDVDNPVVKRIQEIFADKIMYDHLAEDNDYYVKGVNFKDELEKESEEE